MITSNFTGKVHTPGVGSHPVGVRLSYDAATEPLAVHLTFDEGDGIEVTWVVSRELLMRGSTSLTIYGDGDIRMRYEGHQTGKLIMCFRSDEGHADVIVPQALVLLFLSRTADECAVNSDDEARLVGYQIDDLLAEVLGE